MLRKVTCVNTWFLHLVTFSNFRQGEFIPQNNAITVPRLEFLTNTESSFQALSFSNNTLNTRDFRFLRRSKIYQHTD